MEPEEILHEIRNDIREKFDNDIYIMRTVNMVVLEFERRNKQLKQHGVMQAEGSDVSVGAAVASEGEGEANMCADVGCPQCKNTDIYDIDDHWTKCNNCGFTFVG
jgi:hypothetical protein